MTIKVIVWQKGQNKFPYSAWFSISETVCNSMEEAEQMADGINVNGAGKIKATIENKEKEGKQ